MTGTRARGSAGINSKIILAFQDTHAYADTAAAPTVPVPAFMSSVGSDPDIGIGLDIVLPKLPC